MNDQEFMKHVHTNTHTHTNALKPFSALLILARTVHSLDFFFLKEKMKRNILCVPLYLLNAVFFNWVNRLLGKS